MFKNFATIELFCPQIWWIRIQFLESVKIQTLTLFKVFVHVIHQKIEILVPLILATKMENSHGKFCLNFTARFSKSPFWLCWPCISTTTYYLLFNILLFLSFFRRFFIQFSLNYLSLHDTQCGNYENLLSHISNKNFENSMFLLKSWFHEKNWWERIYRFLTLCDDDKLHDDDAAVWNRNNVIWLKNAFLLTLTYDAVNYCKACTHS